MIDAFPKLRGGIVKRDTKSTFACWTHGPCIEGVVILKLPVKIQMTAGRDVLKPGGQPSLERVTGCLPVPMVVGVTAVDVG